MLIKILLTLAALIAIFTVIVALRPSHFSVERSVAIAAPPAVIFPHVNSARAWDAWSPWLKLDPEMKVSQDGPPAGVGSATLFESKKAGSGSSTIVESREPESIRFRLDMTKPFAGTNDVLFTFKPDGARTIVTWHMSGESNFMAKAMGLFVNCERMVGGEFEKGLGSLKMLVESNASKGAVATDLR